MYQTLRVKKLFHNKIIYSIKIVLKNTADPKGSGSTSKTLEIKEAKIGKNASHLLGGERFAFFEGLHVPVIVYAFSTQKLKT